MGQVADFLPRCGIVSSGDGYLVMEGKEFNKRVRDPHTNEVDFS